MKKFLSVLLSIIFAICLLGTLLLTVVRFNFSYSTITKLASEIMKPVSKAPVYDDGLFHPGDKVITLAQYEFDPSALENFDFTSIDITNLDVNEIVQTYLADAGIEVEPEFIAEVLASPEISSFVDKYAGEVVDYMTGAKTELEINPEDVLLVVNTSIDKFEEHTGEVVNIDREEIKQAITESVAAAQEEITATLDTVKEENAETFESIQKALKITNLVLSLKLWLICIGVCVLLAVLIFLLNMNVFAMFKFISIPAIVDGLIIFIAAIVCAATVPKIVPPLIAEYGLPKGIFEGVWVYLSKVLGQMKIYGCVTTLLGVVLCVFGFKLDKKKAA